ncbi:MAG: DUF3575 domain-containing protein [Cytophagales bacterium]|nr:DUF3575 domain-containing protein [Cytophagales bacterium]
MKLKVCLLLLVTMCSYFKILAQTAAVEKHLWKVNALAPGFSYEARLSHKLTLHTETGLTITGFSAGETDGNSYSDVDANFFFSTGMRQYYNFDKRVAKEKAVKGNSGNFIGLRVLAYSDELDGGRSKYIMPGLVWGLQRTYNSRWNLGLELGIGYQFQKDNNTPAPIFSFRFGYRIVK